MSNFKPELSYYNERECKEVTLRYNTYKELKKTLRKNLQDYLEKSSNSSVLVIRSKRGEWGEWFERWAWIHGKGPKIIKQGWM